MALKKACDQKSLREATLRERAIQFHQLAEHFNEVFYLYTLDYSQLLYINPAYETVWQRSCQSLYAHPLEFVESIHPDDRDRIEIEMQPLIEGVSDFRGEYRIIRPDGSERWIYDRTFYIYDEAGNPTQVAGIATDITDRKQAELALQQLNTELEQRVIERTAELTQVNARLHQELGERERTQQALKASQHKYQTLFNILPIGISITDAQGRLIEANPASERILGLTYDEQVQRTYDAADWHIIRMDGTLMPAEEYASVRALRENCFIDDVEKGVVQPNGSICWISVSAAPIPLDDYGVVIAYVDITDRKRAEASLQASEARLRFALEASGAIAWERNLQTDELFFTATTTEAIPFTLSYTDALAQVHPDDRDRVHQANQVAIAHQGSFQIEHRIAASDHSSGWRWLQANARVLYDKQGNPDRLIGMSVDITTLKQVEAALQASEAQTRAVLTAIPDLIVLISRDGIYLDSIRSSSLMDLISTHTNPIGKHIYELLPRAIAERELQAIHQALTTQEPQIYEQQVWIGERLQYEEIRIVACGDNTALIIVRDISDRKQAELTLQESNRRWQSLLDTIELAVIELDRHGTIEYANPFLLNLMGYTQSEVIGQSWFDQFVPSYIKPEVIQVLSEMLAQTSTYVHHQNPILTKSGEERMIAWNNTLLKDTNGALIGTISIGEDITDRDRLEQMKREFVSVVSHELRTPLTSMQAALSLLAERIVDPASEDGQSVIQIAAEGVDRLVRLVNDILDLERLESGKVRLEKQTCDIAQLMTRASEEMHELAKQAGITLKVTPQTCSVYADGDRIVQVLINLLSNAIKFSSSGTVVQLTVAQHEKELYFTVTDQGRGIPLDKLDYIFERFHQIDASDSRAKGGTGLGLAICRSIVQQHGGRIWAESVLGAGSAFHFTLPYAERLSDG
ncbi:MAG: PAS domain S-box protein [Oculatellaceae cyanobacterium bins.114]|nr:PAS domain S-box protein [Oculatellaceae cyanobacterium bins.114]